MKACAFPSPASLTSRLRQRYTVAGCVGILKILPAASTTAVQPQRLPHNPQAANTTRLPPLHSPALAGCTAPLPVLSALRGSTGVLSPNTSVSIAWFHRRPFTQYYNLITREDETLWGSFLSSTLSLPSCVCHEIDCKAYWADDASKCMNLPRSALLI